MNKYFVKIAVVLFLVAFAMSSCDKDESDVATTAKDMSSVTGVSAEQVRSSMGIGDEVQEWHFSLRSKTLSKGVMQNEATYYTDPDVIDYLKEIYGSDYKLVDTLYFPYNGKNYPIKLLRVDRKSEPGKYFYVMIDNLDVKLDTACWAYANNEAYVQKYGRLYTWYAANALAKEITLLLPVYDKNNPTQKKLRGRIPPTRQKARLISRQDICDILECDAIGNLPENSYSLDDLYDLSFNDSHGGLPLYYYDVFVGGLEGPTGNSIDYSRGERSLAGGRGSYQQPQWAWPYYDGNGWFNSLNKEGFFHTNDSDYSDPSIASYVFRIEREDVDGSKFNYSAFINSMTKHGGAVSVRYVFEPQYR